MECLVDNRVCGNTRKCKVCVLDDCRKALEVLEMKEKKKEELKLDKIKKQLHENCKNCSMLQILDIDKEKLYCPYLLKSECLIASVVTRQEGG